MNLHVTHDRDARDRGRDGGTSEAAAAAKLAARHHRLLWRIRRRYPTVTHDVRIGSLCFPFTRVADPDRVLDEVAEEADRREKLSGRRDPDPPHLPYWAELWDSATGLGQFLAHTGLASKPAEEPTACIRVLDLGCGMGLAGTVAAALGARVLFADLEPPALLFARLNSLPYRRRVMTRRLNWQRDVLREKFDLIVGSDILYERNQWEYLEPFWRAHLSEGASVLLGEPGRQTGDLFVPWIASRGWKLEQFAERVPTRATPVKLFRIWKRGASHK